MWITVTKTPKDPVWGNHRLFWVTDVHEGHTTPIYERSQATKVPGSEYLVPSGCSGLQLGTQY